MSAAYVKESLSSSLAAGDHDGDSTTAALTQNGDADVGWAERQPAVEPAATDESFIGHICAQARGGPGAGPGPPFGSRVATWCRISR